MTIDGLRSSFNACLQRACRFARREPIGTVGLLILVTWMIVAVGAIGSGGGWLGTGRYGTGTTFKALNPEFVAEKAAAALDGESEDIAPAEMSSLLADPGVYGPFADVHDEIQDYIQPLVESGELIPILSSGRDPHIEVVGGVIQQVDAGFSRHSDRPLIAAALQDPSGAHWFGTDRGGHDIYANIVDRAWFGLYIGFLATVIGVAGGLVLVVAAEPLRGTRLGRVVGTGVGALFDGLLALPVLLLVLLVVFGHGPRDFALILPLATIALPLVWRAIRDTDSSQSADGSLQRRSIRGLLAKNVHALVRISAHVLFIAILMEAALSFLGLSGTPGSWGILIAQGRQFVYTAPWLTLFAGLALTSVLLGIYACRHALGYLTDVPTNEV